MVAVLDTGIDLGHPDLASNIAEGGIDLVADDAIPEDKDGHGTHVAGIIAASRNRLGVVGVAPRASILPIRVCDLECPTSVIVSGIRYAADHNADVINISLVMGALSKADGGENAVLEAIDYAGRSGAVVVAGAGNDYLPICREPAAHVICVGSVGRDDQKAFYSNFDATMSVNYLVAPGGSDRLDCAELILSTWARGTRRGCHRGPGYVAAAGTSMAAPHVAGVAALLVGQGLEGAAVIQRLIETAEDLGPSGRDAIYGFGLLDASAATHRRSVDR